MLERLIRKPHPRNESSKYAPTESFLGLNNRPSTSCHCPLLLANGSYALALVRDTKPGHHGLVRPDSGRQNLFFPTGHIALDSEPRGRRYANNTGHNRNRLYSRAIHCPASMEMHYVQWFLLKSMYEITDCAKN